VNVVVNVNVVVDADADGHGYAWRSLVHMETKRSWSSRGCWISAAATRSSAFEDVQDSGGSRT
jgi:hypothetical protein